MQSHRKHLSDAVQVYQTVRAWRGPDGRVLAERVSHGPTREACPALESVVWSRLRYRRLLAEALKLPARFHCGEEAALLGAFLQSTTQMS